LALDLFLISSVTMILFRTAKDEGDYRR